MQWIPPFSCEEKLCLAQDNCPNLITSNLKFKIPNYHLYLIPTAEVPLNGLHLDEIIPTEELPLKYVAYTPCFRREAGAAGSQERGLSGCTNSIKWKCFVLQNPKIVMHVFEQMMASAEEILNGLELHYRNALLVTGDMSFAAARTIDIEVWLPGQNRYYEVSSVSNCTDYQSRTLKYPF